MCYISMDSSRQALQTNEKFFSNFQFCFEILTENRKIYIQVEAWILTKLQCLIYQWIRLDKFYELMESYFQIL